MDPNANVQEQIDLLTKGSESGWDADEAERFMALSADYRQWINRGGFPADAGLVAKLAHLKAAQFAR